MSTYAHAVVLDHLLAHKWERVSEGRAGTLWRRSGFEAAVPRHVAAGSPAWFRLAQALAMAEKIPVEQVLAELDQEFVRRSRGPSEQPYEARVQPGRVELDVHLDGRGVEGHETSAYDFGAFVMRTAESVKELVKSSRGTRHASRRLLVAGGVTPGSVRVVLREPDESDANALLAEPPETVEGQAIVLLSAIFAAAEEAVSEPSADRLKGQLLPLSAGARRSIATLADTVADAGWTVSGSVRRGSQQAPLSLHTSAAMMLGKLSRDTLEVTRSFPIEGTLDGWTWSKSELTIEPDTGPGIRVAVPMHLQASVGQLHAQPETRVQALVNETTWQAAGSSTAMKHSYALISIQELPRLA